MSSSRPSNDMSFLKPLVSDLFMIETIYHSGDQVVVTMSYRFDRVRTNKLIKDRLRLAGYKFSLHETDEHLILSVNPRRSVHIPAINVILFVLTLLSVYFVPVFFRYLAVSDSWSDGIARTLEALGRGSGIEFTIAIMSILFVHEMGHYLASRRRHIVTSWPYFIPAPNIIGTFGAIIKSKSPFWNRRDLIEVGAAGPIAGWLVAVGWLVYGLSDSLLLPPDALQPETILFSLDGESVLVRFLVPILIGNAPEGLFYAFSEAAFAGWVGLLVTAINLLPVGQLDGGHILYGLLKKKQHVLGWLAMIGLFVMGYQSMIWWVFAAFGLIFGVSHPPTLDDNRQPSQTSLVLGAVSIIILLVSFTPVPFR